MFNYKYFNKCLSRVKVRQVYSKRFKGFRKDFFGGFRERKLGVMIWKRSKSLVLRLFLGNDIEGEQLE